MNYWLSLLTVPWLLTTNVAANDVDNDHPHLRSGNDFERRMLESACVTTCSGLSIPACPSSGGGSGGACTHPSVAPIELVAGQNIPVGTVDVTNDDDTITVTYVITDSSWCLTETHLQVFDCSVLDSVPLPKWVKNGIPSPGQFSNKTVHDCFDTYTYTVSFPKDVGGCACIATHADVQMVNGGSTETAWGGDLEFSGKNWARYFQYTIEPTVCYQEGEPSTKIKGGGVRFKDFGNLDTGKQVYLGRGDLGLTNPPPPASNRVEKQAVNTGGWTFLPSAPTCIPVSLTFNPTGNSLTATWSKGIPATSEILTYNIGGPTTGIAPPSDWNAIVIILRNTAPSPPTLTTFKDVTILLQDGTSYPVGDFCYVSPADQGVKTIKNLDLSGGFTITGTLAVPNPLNFGKGERSKLEILAIDTGE